MKRRGKIYEHPTLFVSGNVARRVPLFRLFPQANEIFLSNLDFYRKKYSFLLHGYVLMPDHYHLLMTVRPATSMVDLLRDFKSFVGKQVVDSLKEVGPHGLLKRFKLAAPPRRHKDPSYGVLQYDNDIIEVFTPSVVRGKLEYMHNNPVKQGLVSRPGEWEYSSFLAYVKGSRTPIRIDKIGVLSL